MALRVRIPRDAPVKPPKLSTLDRNALHKLEKYGELLLMESRVYFRNVETYVKASQVKKLAEMGLARIEHVGASTFAVFVRNPS